MQNIRNREKTMKVGIAGFGTAGRQVAQALLDGRIAGAELVAVAGRDLEKAARLAAEAAPGLRAVPLAGLPALCDVVVETATGSAFPEIARTVLEAGKDLICVSAGGFLAVPDIEDIARRHGARIRIATGAMPGLDMLRCAAEGTLRKVALKTSIKPESLANEPYVLAQGLDFRHAPPPEPVRVFSGTAREAARHFPRHMNVAVAISLAGIGFDRTTIDMWMDPTIPGAIHELAIDADEVCVTFVSRNFPSSNPKTSRIVAPSILAALRARQAAVLIGS
ncbi:MAG: aspartate dehydrogenase domain-containing protein [Pseudochelatococcus sp.]|uniref:aspartate dehydrogenase domain-containing protein n=1 Tax=Pseudochelatococcus sp. TaxID=2020869 RepID=UPI003D926F25